MNTQKLATWLVKQRLISPRVAGYCHLPTVSAEEYCSHGAGNFQLHSPAKTVACPLPLNIPDREGLNRNCGRYERSFFDVPEFQVGASYSATVRDCRILRTRDQWGDDFYAIVTPDDRLLQCSGTQFRPEHAELLRRGTVTRKLDQAAWVTTHSTRNHYMWLYTHLPRVLLAESLGLKDQILFPAKDLLSKVKLSTLDLLGHSTPQFVGPADEVLHVAELTLVEVDGFDPSALNTMRDRLVGKAEQGPRTRLYISREKCHYRKMQNEAEVWPELAKLGFEKVFLEDLTLEDQIRKLQSADLVLGVHGAGFANVLFCRPGTRIVEIQDPDDPNPHFYALAVMLGLEYCLVNGDVDASQEPHFRDMGATVAHLHLLLK